MKSFKSKSLSKNVTDFEIENGTHSIRFISFESAIELLKEKYPTLNIKPIGYRVIEQGIEIIED